MQHLVCAVSERTAALACADTPPCIEAPDVDFICLMPRPHDVPQQFLA